MRILLAVALLVSTARADTWTGPPVLVTSGEAVLRVAPDLARVRLTTEARAATAKGAQQDEAQHMTAVQQALKQSGLKDEVVRTLSYDLQLEFDYDKGKQTPRGYVARHTIEVRVDDVAKLGEVIGKAIDSGAARTPGPQAGGRGRAGPRRRGGGGRGNAGRRDHPGRGAAAVRGSTSSSHDGAQHGCGGGDRDAHRRRRDRDPRQRHADVVFEVSSRPSGGCASSDAWTSHFS
jgi:hypothetical protein